MGNAQSEPKSAGSSRRSSFRSDPKSPASPLPGKSSEIPISKATKAPQKTLIADSLIAGSPLNPSDEYMASGTDWMTKKHPGTNGDLVSTQNNFKALRIDNTQPNSFNKVSGISSALNPQKSEGSKPNDGLIVGSDDYNAVLKTIEEINLLFVQPKGEPSYKNSSKITHTYGPTGLAPLAPLTIPTESKDGTFDI